MSLPYLSTEVKGTKKRKKEPSSIFVLDFLLLATTACLCSVTANTLFCFGKANSALCRRELAAEIADCVCILDFQSIDNPRKKKIAQFSKPKNHKIDPPKKKFKLFFWLTRGEGGTRKWYPEK